MTKIHNIFDKKKRTSHTLEHINLFYRNTFMQYEQKITPAISLFHPYIMMSCLVVYLSAVNVQFTTDSYCGAKHVMLKK